MAVTIDINPSRVEARVMTAWARGLTQLSEEILADCNEYCKVDTGALIASSQIHSDLKHGKLIWETPYARRQYWDIETSRTPGRTWKWCETAKANHFTRWEHIAARELKKNL